jgi:hypothetical protein
MISAERCLRRQPSWSQLAGTGLTYWLIAAMISGAGVTTGDPQ